MSRIVMIAMGLFLLVGCHPPPKVTRLNLPLLPDHGVMPGEPGRYGGIFVETEPGEPLSFNYLVAEDETSATYIGLCFESLLGWNPITEQFQPALAKSWEVAPDQKTFTFRLRPGLQWSDGMPLTADDVLFTFQAVYDPRYPNRYSTELSDNGEPFRLTKIDELTIQVQTPHIFAPLLLKISGLQLLPKHVLKQFYDDGTLQKQWNISVAQKHPEAIIGSGPFKVFGYVPGDKIILQSNPYYYKTDEKGTRLPYLDFLIKKSVKDLNACTLAFVSGQTDGLSQINPDDVEWVRRSVAKDLVVQDLGASTATNFIWFNQNPGKNKDGKPYVNPIRLRWFQDERFRQAVSYGINRQDIVNGVLFGRGKPLWGCEPENSKWYNPKITHYDYNPERSKQLLTEAGFHLDDGLLKDSLGNPVEFTLNTNQENQIRKNMATVFKENMKDLGITVNLQFLDFNAFVEKITDSYDYEAGMLGFTGGPDPSDGVSIFMSNGRLHQWYPNQKTPATTWEARMDELMVDQMGTLDEGQRRKDYDEVQMIISKQCPFIYLITPNCYVGYRKKWVNMLPTKWDPHFWNMEQLWTR